MPSSTLAGWDEWNSPANPSRDPLHINYSIIELNYYITGERRAVAVPPTPHIRDKPCYSEAGYQKPEGKPGNVEAVKPT